VGPGVAPPARADGRISNPVRWVEDAVQPGAAGAPGGPFAGAGHRAVRPGRGSGNPRLARTGCGAFLIGEERGGHLLRAGLTSAGVRGRPLSCADAPRVLFQQSGSQANLPTDGFGRAHQVFTGVVPEHNGCGIGGWLKAAVVVRLMKHEPRVRWLTTENNGSNAAILAANARLGFEPYLTLTAWQKAEKSTR
jgi:hypothetical protein